MQSSSGCVICFKLLFITVMQVVEVATWRLLHLRLLQRCLREAWMRHVKIRCH